MLQQLDTPLKGSTQSEFEFQEPNEAVSKTNAPHGAQACHSYKQIVLFGDAGDMKHQLDPPKCSTWSEFVLQERNGLFQRQMSPMGHTPAIAISK